MPVLVIAATMAACAGARPPEPESRTIAVLTTTDLHGWVRSWDYAADRPDPRYGLERVATIIDSVRRHHPDALLLDAGDWLQGNAFADYFAKEGSDHPHYPLLHAAESLGYDAFVLGNHEFNYSLEYLNRRISQTSIPILSANVYRHGTWEPAYRPWIIREVQGVKVGVLGITTPGVMVWDRSHVSGMLEVRDGVEAARRWTDTLRARGADLVVVLAHTGLGGPSSYADPDVAAENVGQAILDQVPGVDLLVFGHSHRVTEGEDHIQAGRWGSHLGEALLHVSVGPDGGIRLDSIRTRAWNVVHRAPSAELAATVAAEHDAVRAYLTAPLTQLTETWTSDDARLRDTPMIDLIHRVQLDATGADLSASPAFNTDARFEAGALPRRALSALYPYENTLYTLRVSGKQVREFLEFSIRYYAGAEDGRPRVRPGVPGFNFDALAGATYVWDLSRPEGDRVVDLRVKGMPVQDTDTFTLAVNSYRAEGGGGYAMLAGAPVLARSDVNVRTLIERWLAERDTLRQADVHEVNWRLTW